MRELCSGQWLHRTFDPGSPRRPEGVQQDMEHKDDKSPRAKLDDSIRKAISTKRLISFDYQGYTRLAEPHVYGKKRGRNQILVYQVGGGSSTGGLPQWRRLEVDKISNFKLTRKRFAGRRQLGSSERPPFDEVYAVAG